VALDRLFISGPTGNLGFARPPLALLWLFGIAGLALTTVICFWLGLTSSTVSFIYLMGIVLLSLLDSLISSLIFSIAAVALLDYFFVPPLFSFDINLDTDGISLAAFTVTSIAITGLVRRVRTLGENQSKQAHLLDLAQDAIFVRSLDHEISYWNHGAEASYGWTREEVIGKTSYLLLKTVFPISLVEIMNTVLETDHWEGELTRTRKDGSQIIVATRWTLDRDPQGKPVGLLEISTDITERKRAQEALERMQAAYLAEAQSLSHTGSFAWHVDAAEVVWSEESARIFDYEFTPKVPPEALLARVHPDDQAQTRRAFARARFDGKRVDLEVRLTIPDGQTKIVRVVAHSLAANGHGPLVVGAVMDITESRRADEELQQAQADLARVARINTLGQLAASIGHEINQPLTAIVTNGEAALRFLRRDPPDLDEVRAALVDMVAEGKRAGGIVWHIRSMVKKAVPQTGPLDINALLAESATLVRREITANGGILQFEPGSDLPLVQGDAVQLQQVVINLLINAIQAMADTGVRTRRLIVRSGLAEDGMVVVSIEDSGPGFAEDKAAHLFDAFYTTKPDGMGMGLSICRTIMDGHNGRIWATSAQGKGAVFNFSLPLAKTASTE